VVYDYLIDVGDLLILVVNAGSDILIVVD